MALARGLACAGGAHTARQRERERVTERQRDRGGVAAVCACQRSAVSAPASSSCRLREGPAPSRRWAVPAGRRSAGAAPGCGARRLATLATRIAGTRVEAPGTRHAPWLDPRQRDSDGCAGLREMARTDDSDGWRGRVARTGGAARMDDSDVPHRRRPLPAASLAVAAVGGRGGKREREGERQMGGGGGRGESFKFRGGGSPAYARSRARASERE